MKGKVKPTREEIEADVLKLDPALTDTADETFRAAAVLLFVAHTGCFDQRQVASALGYPSPLVAKFFFNLRRSHVFQGRKIHAAWDDPEEGFIAFWLDCAVAQGLLEATGRKGRGAKSLHG